jgi:hypothetical protein
MASRIWRISVNMLNSRQETVPSLGVVSRTDTPKLRGCVEDRDNPKLRGCVEDRYSQA